MSKDPIVRQAAPPPWRELQDHEYYALSLRHKMEHQIILAMEADLKAGPMWAKGAPIAIEDMPLEYHRLKAKAQNHREEAKTLREKIKREERK